MRYNGSILTVENSPKSSQFKYKKIPKLILIMFCEFDLFKKGKPIYEIIRYVKDTKVIADDGIREIYVNLKAKSTDKKLKSLFKIMTTVSDIDDKTFPKLSKRKEEINSLYIGGDRNMAGLDLMMYKDGLKEGRKEGIQQGMQQGSISVVLNMFKQKLIDISAATKALNMTENEFLKLLR